MAEHKFIIGIDTGGTYTDAVVIDAGARKVMTSAKAITTKGDLSVGVSEALRAVLAAARVPLAQVAMVSVSTTLATNAVVEGHGGAAGLVLIGFDEAMEQRSGLRSAFPQMPIARVSGGHDHAGAEARPLDEAAIREFVAANADAVSAFAVASAFAVRNPMHELRAAEIIAEACARPVTLSHQLADALDAPRRAQTAVLNARLVSRISDLANAVRSAMAALELRCPLMIVRGDGSLALADAVAARPIETVLSGPAASMIGAKWLSGCQDFILSDMGGTTTDVGLLTEGLPHVAEQGAEVGAWRTMVKAIDVKTIGLGGDSEVHVGPGGQITLGPERALPLSLLAARRPETLALLAADLAETTSGSMLGKFLVLPFGAKERASAKLGQKEAEVLAQIGEAPLPLRKVATGSASIRAITSLRRKGLIQFAALTPSDAAHALKLQANWDGQVADIAIKIYAKFADMKLPDEARALAFAEQIRSEAVRRSAGIILDVAAGGTLQGPLVESVTSGKGAINQLRISLAPSIPIVAVGGPVKIYYPDVSRRLNCEVVFAPHCDVANAVGAACAEVVARASAQVDGDGSGLFRLTGQGPAQVFASAREALAKAHELTEQAARTQARRFGAASVNLRHAVSKDLMPNAKDDEGLLIARIVAEARGSALEQAI